MEGFTLLVVREVDIEGSETGGYVVAVDAVGAGPGETVLFATGSAARQTLATEQTPCDAVIMAIIDTWEVEGTERYQKSDG